MISNHKPMDIFPSTTEVVVGIVDLNNLVNAYAIVPLGFNRNMTEAIEIAQIIKIALEEQGYED